jgi:hypothetical protein
MLNICDRLCAGSLDGGLTPAYVLDRVEGQLMWRLMQAQGAPPEACPPGYGDGEYVPLPGVRTVVKVVGTAHMRGMMQRWPEAVSSPREVRELLRDLNASSDV